MIVFYAQITDIYTLKIVSRTNKYEYKRDLKQYKCEDCGDYSLK